MGIDVSVTRVTIAATVLRPQTITSSERASVAAAITRPPIVIETFGVSSAPAWKILEW